VQVFRAAMIELAVADPAARGASFAHLARKNADSGSDSAGH
jgi:hypothetical protein